MKQQAFSIQDNFEQAIRIDFSSWQVGETTLRKFAPGTSQLMKSCGFSPINSLRLVSHSLDIHCPVFYYAV